jgi:hypothetical protein
MNVGPIILENQIEDWRKVRATSLGDAAFCAINVRHQERTITSAVGCIAVLAAFRAATRAHGPAPR